MISPSVGNDSRASSYAVAPPLEAAFEGLLEAAPAPEGRPDGAMRRERDLRRARRGGPRGRPIGVVAGLIKDREGGRAVIAALDVRGMRPRGRMLR